jgi:hypothetical protein
MGHGRLGGRHNNEMHLTLRQAKPGEGEKG